MRVEEIKMFVGTNLKCIVKNDSYDEDAGYSFKFKNIKVVGIYDMLVLGENDDSYSLDDIRPQVKLLAKLTEQEAEKFLISPKDLMILKVCKDINLVRLSWHSILELVKEHYDIFNWIEHNLADRIKEENK